MGACLQTNLSRFSSFATAIAPEANLGSREEGGSTYASLQRSILRTQAHHYCWSTAKNEESSPSASGLSGLQISCATQPIEQRRKCSASGEADTSGDIFCGRVGPYAQLSGSHENLTDSGSEIAVPLSTAKNSALLRPRLSPLKASRSRRLATAASRQILRRVRASNETISPGGPKPPVLSRTRQHDMKVTIPARASWRLQRARWRRLAGLGIRPRLEARRERAVAISSLTNFVNSVSLEIRGRQCGNMSHPL